MEVLFEKTDYEIELFRDDAAYESTHVWTNEKHYIRDDAGEIEEDWINNRLKIVHSTFEKEYDSYVKKRKYFYGCTHELYLETFKERLSLHLSKHEDYTLITFIESEFKDGVFLFNRPYVSSEKMQKIQASLRKRYEFLVERAQEEKYNIILLENDTVQIKKIVKNTLIDDEDLIEDDSETFEIKERVIAMYQLGILDYLNNHQEINSVSKIVKAIETITGFGYTTLQSYINPIFNEFSDQANSAIRNKKKVKKIQKHLDNHVLKTKK